MQGFKLNEQVVEELILSMRVETNRCPGSTKHIKEILEICYWASLKKEESRPIKFQIAIIQSDRVNSESYQEFVFNKPIKFAPEEIRKLAPAINPNHYVIGVYPMEKDVLKIWGFAQNAEDAGREMDAEDWANNFSVINDTWLSVKSLDAGKILISFGKALILFDGNEIKRVSPYVNPIEDFLNKCFPNQFAVNEVRAEIYKDIAKVILAHGKGGTLLLYPTNSDISDSVGLDHLPFDSSSYSIPEDLFRKYIAEIANNQNIENYRYLLPSINLIGNLTGIDGAVAMTFDLAGIKFGAKIRGKDPQSSPSEFLEKDVFVNEEGNGMDGDKERIKEESADRHDIKKLGGTRHQSAAQFIFDQRDSIAIVASQDGRLSVLTWDKEKEIVSAVRDVEYIIL